jgi:beta-aspartyl-peptidase (threonine type)
MNAPSDNHRVATGLIAAVSLSIAGVVLCSLGCRPHDAAPSTSSPAELSAGQAESIRAAIEAVLRAQEEAWNRGDIDRFVDYYWKSDELTFSSGGKTTRGWTATLNRYRQRYPTPEKMGHLTMSGLEITPLGGEAALVLGQWNLARESEPLSGNFSLVLRKIGDRWLIIHDHTSRTEP